MVLLYVHFIYCFTSTEQKNAIGSNPLYYINTSIEAVMEAVLEWEDTGRVP